jgi:hypothetical protein
VVNESEAILACRQWVEEVVVGLNLCPFAAQPMGQGRVRFHATPADQLETIYQSFLQELDQINRLDEAEVETALFIIPRGLEQFSDYLELLTLAEEVIAEAGLEGLFQLASFHPDYRFEGATADDPANYTNRSPYPMIHVIREAPLSRALESYPNPEQIPQRNVQLLRDMGIERVQAQLAHCLVGEED